MQINTRVVEALMRLRGFSRKSLAQIAGVRLENLNAWIDANDGGDLYVSPQNQREILHALGVSGEGLRSDCVHHWKIQERYFSNEVYADVQIMLHAFGEALAVVFQRSHEPAISFSKRQVFGLRFAEACVVLEVTAPYLKSVYFDPENFEGLRWAFDDFVALLAEKELDRLIGADMTPSEFDDFATGKIEAEKWGKLHLIAREYSISPDDVEDWMVTKAKAANMGATVAKTESVTFKKVANGSSVPSSMSTSSSEKEAQPVPVSQAGFRQKAPVSRMEDYRLFQTENKNS